MRKKLKSKLLSRRGFTIGEVLVSVLILMMVFSIVAAGIPTAANAYYKVVDSANAQMLLSTTLTRLRAELSTATEVKCSDTTVSYRSAAGRKSEISLEQPASGEAGGNNAGIYLEIIGLAQKQPLVSEQAASGLYMTYSGVIYDKEKGVITFQNLIVKKGDQTLASAEDFRVRVLLKETVEENDEDSDGTDLGT
jgi:hypothetical protein